MFPYVYISTGYPIILAWSAYMKVSGDENETPRITSKKRNTPYYLQMKMRHPVLTANESETPRITYKWKWDNPYYQQMKVRHPALPRNENGTPHIIWKWKWTPHITWKWFLILDPDASSSLPPIWMRCCELNTVNWRPRITRRSSNLHLY